MIQLKKSISSQSSAPAPTPVDRNGLFSCQFLPFTQEGLFGKSSLGDTVHPSECSLGPTPARWVPQRITENVFHGTTKFFWHQNASIFESYFFHELNNYFRQRERDHVFSSIVSLPKHLRRPRLASARSWDLKPRVAGVTSLEPRGGSCSRAGAGLGPGRRRCSDRSPSSGCSYFSEGSSFAPLSSSGDGLRNQVAVWCLTARGWCGPI